VDQFLDLGSGIPTVGNVHEVAQSVNSRARVVYVDNDPVAVAHSRALLEENTYAAAVHADIREPEATLAAAVATGLIDLRRPVGVLLLSVLHFIPDSDQPAALVARYMEAVGPGSYLALSCARGDGRAEAEAVEEVYERQESPMRMYMRSWTEIEALFGSLSFVDPGLVHVPLWHPELADDLEPEAPVPGDYPGVGGLGRRD
jgi:S-adenosyl methyltransferase